MSNPINNKTNNGNTQNTGHKSFFKLPSIKKFWAKKSGKIPKTKLEDIKKEIQIDEHKITIEKICERYGLDISTGLSTNRAQELLKLHGPNTLTPPKEKPEWLKLIGQLTNPFALLLWLGAFLSIISFVISYASNPNTIKEDLYLAVGLIFVVVVTGIFQYYQEKKSEKIMETFQKMIPQKALVLRNGIKEQLTVDVLVPGDIVYLRIGDRIPADVRIIESTGFKVDNSSLTGESEPQSRSPNCTSDNPLETKNLAFFSTSAVEGTATGVVIKTGDETAMGRIAHLTAHLKTNETHLAQELSHFVHIVTIAAIIFGIIFFSLSMSIGSSVLYSLLFLIGVVVAIVPESLQACLAVALTLTAKRMAKKNCLVKHLEAVEGLGAIGIICTDKTGTLTMNRMTASHIWMDDRIIEIHFDKPKDTSHLILDDKQEPHQKTNFNTQDSVSWKYLVRCAALCNKAEFKSDVENLSKEVMKRSCTGDASEQALLQYTEYFLTNVIKYREDNKKVFEVPFNSTNKYQVSVHELNNEPNTKLIAMKGAPERILEYCKTIQIGDAEFELTEEWKKQFTKVYEELGGMGERVLGFCDKIITNEEFASYKLEEHEVLSTLFPPKNMRFLGFFSLIDPPKPNVTEAILKCRSAGIKVFMVTGDHPITAEAIAKSVGIISEETKQDIAKRLGISQEHVNPIDVKAFVLHGTDLAKINEHELTNILLNYREIVFARTSPQQKLLIVEACQNLGVLVGVTGDGVNDSPAMKKADIGISMGITGSDVSKQVADLVLLDDNFATIVAGVEEGRLIFDNISNIIKYSFSKTIAQLAPLFVYIFIAQPLAVSTITILCVDLGTDLLLSLSLSYETAEGNLMLRHPRDLKKDKMTNSKLVSWCYGQIGLIETAAGLFAYSVVLAENGFLPSRLIGIRAYWDSVDINDLKDSFGGEWTYSQRKFLQNAAQSAFYVGIVLTQISNAFACKTKRETIVKHLTTNIRLYIGVIATIGLSCLLLYVPGLNSALTLYPLRFVWWLTPLPFSVYILSYTELIKYFARSKPNGWVDTQIIP